MDQDETRPRNGPGRVKGSKNKHETQNKKELRALTQESVFHYIYLRRKEIKRMWYEGWRWDGEKSILYMPYDSAKVRGERVPPDLLDMIQPRMEEFDPVVELSIMASDYRNGVAVRRQASADAAQYLRPKLKNIELSGDGDLNELESQRVLLQERMFDLLKSMAQEKKLLGMKVINQ